MLVDVVTLKWTHEMQAARISKGYPPFIPKPEDLLFVAANGANGIQGHTVSLSMDPVTGNTKLAMKTVDSPNRAPVTEAEILAVLVAGTTAPAPETAIGRDGRLSGPLTPHLEELLAEPADRNGSTPRPADVMEELTNFHRDGHHLIPVRSATVKVPVVKWHSEGVGWAVNWVENQPSLDDIARWAVRYPHGTWFSLCGGPSQELVLDIEAPGMNHPAIIEALAMLPDTCKLTSPGGGMHGWVIDADLLGTDERTFHNTPLARDKHGVLLAEIRGHLGGAVLVAGGRTPVAEPFAPHPLTRVELDAIIKKIREADAHPDEALKGKSGRKASRQGRWLPKNFTGAAEPTDTAEVLFRAVATGQLNITALLDDGWTDLGHDDDGRRQLLRPEYSSPSTAQTSANEMHGSFVCHSTSVPWIDETGVGYAPAKVYADARFGGDFHKAMASLEGRAARAVAAGTSDDADWPLEVLQSIVDARAVNRSQYRGSPLPDGTFTRLNMNGGTSLFPPDPPPSGNETADGNETPDSAAEADPDDQPQTAKAHTDRSSGMPTAETMLRFESFFDERDEFGKIRDYARARRMSPWAVLIASLVRLAVTVPPNVVLPDIIGAHASLNLFAFLTGPSGSGKGGAMACSSNVINFNEGMRRIGRTGEVVIGSGEGISHQFVRRDRVTNKEPNPPLIQYRDAVLFTATEVSRLTTLGTRTSSTLFSELCSAWSGEAIGTAGYVDRAKAMPVHAHKYRLCVLVGAQPDLFGPVLAADGMGFPQRGIYLPAADPLAPDVAPDRTEGPALHLRDEFLINIEQEPIRRVVIDIAESIVQEIDEERLTMLRGGTDDSIDSHATLNRLKIAALLRILHARIYWDEACREGWGVTEDDWRLAGIIMELSAVTRAAVDKALAIAGREANLRAGRASGVRRVAEEEVTTAAAEDVLTAAVGRVSRWIQNYLSTHGATAGSKLRRACAQRDRRDFFGLALDALVGAGLVRETVTELGHEYAIV